MAEVAVAAPAKRESGILRSLKAIALIRDGDIIDIDIPNRTGNLRVDGAELTQRRCEEDARPTGWRPRDRQRQVSAALRAYAAMATSADKGAVRDVDRLEL